VHYTTREKWPDPLSLWSISQRARTSTDFTCRYEDNWSAVRTFFWLMFFVNFQLFLKVTECSHTCRMCETGGRMHALVVTHMHRTDTRWSMHTVIHSSQCPSHSVQRPWRESIILLGTAYPAAIWLAGDSLERNWYEGGWCRPRCPSKGQRSRRSLSRVCGNVERQGMKSTWSTH